jgi:hypothetical protein
MSTRKELIEAVRARYGDAPTSDRTRIVDEFVALTGYHRKYATRVLGSALGGEPPVACARNRLYDEAVRQALVVVWEAGDRVCGKRLHPLIPILIDAMERHGHLALDPLVKARLLQVSAATIDRSLSAARASIDGQRKRRAGTGAAIRRSVPVRTFADWRDPPPGFFEVDMVEHCGGPKTDGDFVHTLVLTDIASGWTECVAMPLRNQSLVVQAMCAAEAQLPFAMLGVDTDNDSAFMNQTVFDYCKGKGLEQTRSRAYKKNDQAWVEQKNGAIVRRLVGYGRLTGLGATAALAQLYAASRLYVNFFQPSFKLKSKTRDGARVSKKYHRPATPCDRLLAFYGLCRVCSSVRALHAATQRDCWRNRLPACNGPSSSNDRFRFAQNAPRPSKTAVGRREGGRLGAQRSARRAFHRTLPVSIARAHDSPKDVLPQHISAPANCGRAARPSAMAPR